MKDKGILSSAETEDENYNNLRPSHLSEFVGQSQLKSNLSIFIESAKTRNETLDHVLLYGPPGLGKTTIASIISKELNVNFKPTSGPMITKSGDLAAILTNLQQGDVLFIDEIHRLNTQIEEVLYSAMEDFKIDVMIGEGPSARSLQIDLPKFTLVAATTRLGLLSGPLRDRFGIPLRLNFYNYQELEQVIKRAAVILNVQVEKDGLTEIARRSRGTPRIALRLLKRVRDFAIVKNSNIITKAIVDFALNMLEVDKMGLDGNDVRYLRLIAEFYEGGPVGIETIAAALSEQRDSIEETIEPYLLQSGFIQRTPRGRILTPIAYEHLNIENVPRKKIDNTQGNLDI